MEPSEGGDTDHSSDTRGVPGEDGSESTSAQGKKPAGESPPAGDSDTKPPEVIRECLTDPEGCTERLPYVVGLLTSSERSIRLSAAWVCCLIAVEQDDADTTEYLIRRLTDRLSDEDVPLELTSALDYLSSRYPELAESLLQDMEEERDVSVPRVGNFTRSHYYREDDDLDSERTGRTRMPAEDTDPEATDANDDGDTDTGKITSDTRLIRRTSDVTRIAVKSRFDELHITGAHYNNQFADIYEALVGEGRNKYAVALRLLKQPEDGSDRIRFRTEITEPLQNWSAVDSNGNVVSILDWGVVPKPWLATVLAGESLADRERSDLGPTLREARVLTEATASAHQSGVVHGAIEPDNVVYSGASLDETSAQAPLLDNVALIHVFRHHFSPARCLDPRYAAPEYFSTRFGRIDHATDIYHLGAVFFRMFTGQHPYTGEFEAIRTAVTDEKTPVPSAVVEDLPDRVDHVVSKAMATRKIHRYETVEHLQQEVRSIAEDYGNS